MALSELDAALGRLLVEKQLLDQEQLNGLISLQEAMPESTLSEVLVDSGFVTAEELDTLMVEAQMAAAPAPVITSKPSVKAIPAPAPRMATPAPAAAPAMLDDLLLEPVDHGGDVFAESGPGGGGDSTMVVPVPNAAATMTPAKPAPRPAPVMTPAKPSPVPAAASKPASAPLAGPGGRPAVPKAPLRQPSKLPEPAAAPAQPAQKARGAFQLMPVMAPAPVEPEPAPQELLLEPVAEPEPTPKLEPVFNFTPSENPREEMVTLLKVAVDMEVSDLHLHSDCKIIIRHRGELKEQETPRFSPPRATELVMSVMTDQQRELFETKGELDFAFTLPGVGRFRANAYRNQRGVDGVFRFVPLSPPTLASLGLPESLGPLTDYHNGLVLFTGPSGCGKSTSMAALINMINERRDDHIISIEDPVEFLHPSKKCTVNQRQVGVHTESFGRALRGALREDPNVIVVGELRDLETISLALSAAETGHLVLGTLHTANAIRTVNRLINAYPSEQHDQVRAMLSESLRAVISQRLVKHALGTKLIPALEVMLVNKAISNLIRENKTPQIRSILQTAGGEGMCLLDASLAALVQQGHITKEEAAKHAEDPKRFGGTGA